MMLARLAATVAGRAAADPATSYTARLIAEGPKRLAQKVGEEGVEVALAAVAGDAAELTSEAADLVYHLTVLLEASDSSWAAVLDELHRRHGASKPTASS
jgi:phosphoribosyl-ATP pyrophosphohydrolase/phosphoribosyl-AMP cyclohydrolase